MIIGIMQPYFFPYLGYWQHMNAVDRYVVYDDVNYIKGGRINRNEILINGRPNRINLLLQDPSPNKLINEINIIDDYRAMDKMMKTIDMAYHKAPYYSECMPVLEKIICNKESSLSRYLFHSFIILKEYLNIQTELILSSEIDKDCNLHGYRKVIDICKLLEGDVYYNSISGLPLYTPHLKDFNEAGIKVYFTKKNEIMYKQFNNEFIDNLSIIDVMMFNSRSECNRLLSSYHLEGGNSDD